MKPSPNPEKQTQETFDRKSNAVLANECTGAMPPAVSSVNEANALSTLAGGHPTKPQDRRKKKKQ